MTGQGVFWLASYPKSGNTWIRIALSCLRNDGRPPDLANPNTLCANSASLQWIEDVLDLPVEDLTLPEQIALRAEACRLHGLTIRAPALLKVHDAYDPELFRKETTAGSILIVRDPRDIAPSWADHLGLTLDDTIQRMGWPDFTLARLGPQHRDQAQQRLNSWSANVRSWLDDAPGPKLLMRYEDLLAQPGASFIALAAFIGLEISEPLLRATMEACSFGALRAAEVASGFSERSPLQKAFFRQGRAGAWRDTLSPAQADQLWHDHREMMIRLGYGEDGTISSAPPQLPPAHR